MSKSCFVWVLLAALVLCAWVAPSARAQYTLDTLSNWGGFVKGFQKVGSVGFLCSGMRLVALDMSDDSNIHELGSVLFQSEVQDVTVRNGLAYVTLLRDYYRTDSCTGTALYAHLKIVNVSNPAAMQVVWVYPEAQDPVHVKTSGGHSRKFRFVGNSPVAYWLEATSELKAFHVNNPRNPLPELYGGGCSGGCPGYYPCSISEVPLSNGDPEGADGGVTVSDYEVVGNLLYVASTRNWLRVYSLQDPFYPALLGQTNIGDPATEGGSGIRLAVSGTTAIVSALTASDPNGHGAWVYLFDVSDPSNPHRVGSFQGLFNANGVAVQGNLAFVADWLSSPSPYGIESLKGLAILDISNPASPVLVGRYNTPHSSIMDVKVDGNRAYLLDQGEGLVVLDISNPASLTRVGRYYSPAVLRNLTKVGSRLYIADVWNGFSILDVADPSSPHLLGVYENAGGVGYQNSWQVAVGGSRAYLAGGFGGFQVVDISNPVEPQMVQQYMGVKLAPSISTSADAVALVGNVLYTCQFALDSYSYATYDVSGPTISGPLGLSDQPGSCDGRFAAKGPAAILGGSVCVDNTDAAHIPDRIIVDGGMGGDAQFSGNLMLKASGISTNSGLLKIFDASNPLNPALSSSTVLGLRSTSVGGSGYWAYVADSSMMQAFNISNPASPALIATSTYPGASHIVAEGDLVYSAGYLSGSDASGLTVRRLTPPQPPGAFSLLAPTNGLQTTDTAPMLSWSTASGVDSYTVTLSEHSDLTSPIISGTLTATSEPISAGILTVGHTYYWNVVAVNANGSTIPTTDPVYSFRIIPPPPPCADVSFDGKVDTLDLGIILSEFGQTISPYQGGDINGDGVVNTLDLGLVLSQFGQACH